MSYPTKILKYDLDEELRWVFEDVIKAVIGDLVSAYETEDKTHVSDRIKTLEKLSSHTSFLLGDENASEAFTYAEEFGSKDVVKHEYNGSKSFTEEYEYGLITIANEENQKEEKAIVKSKKTYQNSEGKTIAVNREYSYDTDGDITGITTSIELVESI